MKRLSPLVFLALFALVLPACGGEPLRLGIYAGTFDPFHHQHLQLAREAADLLHLDRVLIVPNASNVRKPGMSALDLRYPAIEDTLRDLGDPRLVLLPQAVIEQATACGPPEGAARRLLQAAAATAPRATVFQILGSDSFFKIVENDGLPKPGDRWVLAVKPRAAEARIEARLARSLQKIGVLQFLPEGQVEMSSTLVRQAAAAGDVAFLQAHLPPAVVRHVVKHRMYGIASAPGWLDALLDLGPDPADRRAAGGAGHLTPRSGQGRPSAADTFPEVPPDSAPCAIDPAEPHSLGDLRAYVTSRLTPLGMAVLGRPEVRVHLVKGRRQRVDALLIRYGITRAVEISRSRDYITLGIVLGRDLEGTWRAFIGDIYGRTRLLHTEAMVALSLRFGNRAPTDFSIIEYPAGVTERSFLGDVYRTALEKVPPGLVDLAIVGYHWKVQQQLNLRLAAWKVHPSPWAVLDGRAAAGLARFKPGMRSPQTLPQWPRRHYEGWDLPFSFLFFRNRQGTPATVLLTRNVYGDQLPALLDVLYRDKGIRRIVLFGSAGGLSPEARLGDLVAASAVSLEPGQYRAVSNPWQPSPLPPAAKVKPLRRALLYSAFSPLEETAARMDLLRRERAGIVDVELGHVPDWLDSLGTAPVDLRSLAVVSDVPGSGLTLEKLSAAETELSSAFPAAVDRILQEYDLVAPFDSRGSDLDRP